MKTLIAGTQLGNTIHTASPPASSDSFERLKTYEFGQDRRVLTVIEKQVTAASSQPAESAAIEIQLAAVLESDATFDAKQFVCRQLRLVGSAQSVPVLAKLLTDPRLSGMARYALESNPDPAAGRALRAALATTRGELLIGVMNSLGQRRDRAAVDQLKPWIKFQDEQIARAAIAALGKISGKKALSLLRSILSRNPEPHILDAVLAAAYELAAGGETAKAASVFRSIHDKSTLAMHVRFAALRGLLQTDPEKARPLIESMARKGAEAQRRMAASLLEKPAAPAGRIKP